MTRFPFAYTWDFYYHARNLDSGCTVAPTLEVCMATVPVRIFFYYYYWWGGTKSLGTAATSGLLYKPQMIDEDDCRAIGGMKIGRGNRSTRRKPAAAPLYPPQIRHDQTRARTPGHRGGKPATNRLSYGAAQCVVSSVTSFLLLCFESL
jgi:hypothetical protein